jgi:hypothetical protein
MTRQMNRPPDPPNEPLPELNLTKHPDSATKSEVIAATRPEDELSLRIQNRQDWVRTTLALGGFTSLVIVLLLLLVSVTINQLDVEKLDKVGIAIVTPLTGIVGAIVGFYFAERGR